MKYECLIVDDDELLSENTCEYFNMFGVKTAWVADEKSCLEFLHENKTDLILLDVNLGNSSGFDLCVHLRKTSNVPILFISARLSDDDMLLGLNVGGDDYIRKPYTLTILLAKVKAVLKRYKSPVLDINVFTAKDLCINFTEKSVFVGGYNIELKAMEYKLLFYFAKNINRVIPKEELFRNVWEESIVEDNTLNVHIRRLREKIEKNPNDPCYIKTVRGTGYIFEVDL